MIEQPKIGQTLNGPNPGRDAVHIAIIPMVATRTLQPGQHLKFGIVDPYLEQPVEPNEVYYLFLYPNSVTSLRHVWEHPSFPKEAP